MKAVYKGLPNNKKELLFSKITIILILFVGTLVLILMKNKIFPTTEKIKEVYVSSVDTINIPVLKNPLVVGEMIVKDNIEIVSFPKNYLTENYLTNYDEAISGYFALANLPAKFPIQLNVITKSSDNLKNPMLAKIPKGMRAMTVKVDATSAVEGWAGSGSVVDVLLIERARTIVVAESVKILSAERSLSPVSDISAPNIPSTVTLLVTQEECLAISTAIPRGKIELVLRNNTDNKNWEKTSLESDNLLPNKSIQSEEIKGYFKVGSENFTLINNRWLKSDLKYERLINR